MKKKLYMPDLMSSPKYQGKHLIIAGGKLYVAKTGKGASRILKDLEKKDPTIIPEIGFMPKTSSLILWM